VLLAVYTITDKTNHRLYLNPIADFEFGINAAIIRPENIEPPLIKGKLLEVKTAQCTVLYKNICTFTEELFQLVLYGVELTVTCLYLATLFW
jgi:hypothetical protein